MTGIGFACELLGMMELSGQQQRRRTGSATGADSMVSDDSLRIRGLHSESEIELQLDGDGLTSSTSKVGAQS